MAPARIHRAFDALFGRAGSEPATEAVEDVEVETVSAPPEAAEPEPEPTVDERGARAILASAQPPLPPEPRAAVPRTPPPSPEPRSEPDAGPPREWNLWDLQRAARDAPREEQREEWSALLIHLREFANADGDLPAEFDTLVRESFGRVLDEPEPAAAP